MTATVEAAPVIVETIVEIAPAIVETIVTAAVAETIVAAAVAQAAPITEASELLQIETAPGKVAVEVPAERPQPVNRRRTRQLEVYVENEPLVQIETQHPKV